MLVNEEEKRLSLMGIWFRINDKVERIKTTYVEQWFFQRMKVWWIVIQTYLTMEL